MSDAGALLAESIERMLAERCTRDVLASAEAGQWPSGLWSAAADMGLHAAAQGESRGGFGTLDARDLCGILRSLGRHAAPLPIPETWLAEHMLAAAGLPPLGPAQLPATVGPVIAEAVPQLKRTADGWALTGTLRRVPWARHARTVVVLAGDGECTRTVAADIPAPCGPGRNAANEPRDSIRFDAVPISEAAVGPAATGYLVADLVFDGALHRGAQMVGAMEGVLRDTVRYANERVQFGRPIGKFQAVQQQIAVLAGEVAVASAAAHGAADARSSGPARFEIACAKIRIGEAAGKVAAIAHQVHAAIGFTHEHNLHHATRRLWAWRDEFGSEAEWSRWVGTRIAQVGGEELWPFITDPQVPPSRDPLW